MATVPVTSVPIKLPATVLLLAVLSRITPSSVLPEIEVAFAVVVVAVAIGPHKVAARAAGQHDPFAGIGQQRVPVTQRRRAMDIDTDVVALDAAAGRQQVDAGTGVAGDHIPLHRQVSADLVVGTGDVEAVAVGKQFGAGDVGTDQVAGDDGAVGSPQIDTGLALVTRNQVAFGGVAERAIGIGTDDVVAAPGSVNAATGIADSLAANVAAGDGSNFVSGTGHDRKSPARRFRH